MAKKIAAVCENGGKTTLVESNWIESVDETRQISEGGEEKQLRKGMCQSKSCTYLGRCTLKVLFELKTDDDSVIFESRWKRRNLQ